MAARLGVVILFKSDLLAKTASRSKMYNSSWRLSGGSSVIKAWYALMAASGSKSPWLGL